MKRLFLFAIGGTGARVVRSLTMMLASGVRGLGSDTEIVPIIIDYDLSNGDKTRAIKALESYQNIHNQLYANRNVVYDDHFFMTSVRPLKQIGTQQASVLGKDFEYNFGPSGSSKKFSQYLGLRAMENDPNIRITGDLLNALYDNSEETSKDAELELDMAKGFKGNPNIGSVVFHELREMAEFKAFNGVFNAQTDRVFIISSIFGGTGASGFPEIVNAIRQSNMGSLRNAIVGAAVILPYFKLKQCEFTNGDTGAVDANSFNAKTKAALGFYDSSNGVNTNVDAIYYVGDENCDSYDYHEGETHQQNNAHVVEFVAATSVIDFMQKTGFVNNPDVNGQITHTGCAVPYEFAIGKQPGDSTAIMLPDFYDSTHKTLLDNLSSFVIAMKYYRDVVCGDSTGNKISNVGYNSDNRFNLNPQLGSGIYLQLDEFLRNNGDWGFFQWLEELKNHTHILAPYITDSAQEMKYVLSHKVISVSIGQNPIKYSVLTGLLNSSTTNMGAYNTQTFLKALRDVMSKKYNEVK